MPPVPTRGPTSLSALLARPQLQSSPNPASGLGGHGSSSTSAEMARSLRQQLLQRSGASGSYPTATTALLGGGPAVAPDGPSGLRALDSFLGVQQQQQQGPFQRQTRSLDAEVGHRGVSGASPLGTNPVGAFSGSGGTPGMQGEQYRGNYQAVQLLRQQEQLLGMQQQQHLLHGAPSLGNPQQQQQQQLMQQSRWAGLGGGGLGGGGAGPVGSLDEMESPSLQGRRQLQGLLGPGMMQAAQPRRDALNLQPQQLQQPTGPLELGAGQLDLKAAAQGILGKGACGVPSLGLHEGVCSVLSRPWLGSISRPC